MGLLQRIAIFALAFLAVAPQSWAGTCDQAGIPNCGPCGYAYNLTKDGGFDYDCNPAVWSFGPHTYRATSGSISSCGYPTWLAPFAQVDGPTNGWAFFWQDTLALDGTSGWSHFGFGYTIDINDSNPSNQVYVEIIDLNTNEHWGVDYVTGAHSCETHNSLQLGNHPNWVGHTLRVQFDTYLVNSASVKIESVNFWQGQY
ncbi:MAG: hypothetical protein JF614_27775 [Acidobacteria bacterium]|nr:hypothetical protein [Acidobacteriota bacterium]